MWCGVVWCGVAWCFFRLDAPAAPCARSRARGRGDDRPIASCSWRCLPSLELAEANAHASHGRRGVRQGPVVGAQTPASAWQTVRLQPRPHWRCCGGVACSSLQSLPLLAGPAA